MPVLRRTSSTTHARATLDGGVTIYWRPGCPLCARLRSALRQHNDRITWVNIREDPEAAAFVRTTNPGGHELVPVAVIAGVAHPRPTPRLVLAALR
ncbi:glutaredoxin domain-containing protein [Nocardioides sp. 1609]|uniref:glutaredoxin family protein n=1 Tax=Nocardioides sp. 1609 TaxID=2508327 RepID=UPI001070364E|nr:glutaredoxin domain-containing protein [Nocardioides sp. 1609]